MAKVSIQHLFKIYPGPKGQDVTAVRDVSIEIPDREFVVLVGPSGCGKSTTLRMVAGLEEISKGDVFIGETRVNEIPPKDRDIAMVFQNYALYPDKTVRENMAFGLVVRGRPKAEIEKRVNEAAAILGIEQLLDRKPKALSGGQRQRVAVGRAIVRQPKVFLFDEPLSNLDAKMRVQMRTEIKKLHQRLQATMIYVTHDQIEAMTMGDRIVVMKDGVVQQIGPPLEIYHLPVNLFVAGFLGSPPMNFLKGALSAAGEHLVFKEIEGGVFTCRFRSADRPALASSVGREVMLGLRPEDLAPSRATGPKDAPAGMEVFPSVVDLVEPMGAETNFYLQTGAHTLVCRTPGSPEGRESGHRMRFQFDPARAHLFDPETSLRLA